jgi:iron complex outermembrane receptor protein
MFWLASLMSAPLAAEEVLEEIVVTADLLGRDSAALPVSLSVLDQNMIQQAAVQHFEELIFTIPNLNWSGDGNRARYLQIRGVGELEQYQGAPNPSVGFMIDDIDFSGVGSVATLFDIQRIEVLRGPQGSRYGANALAGLVYVQSADPTDEFALAAELTTGDDGLLAAGLGWGGPLAGSEQLKYRVSAHRHDSDGFRVNPFLGRSDTNGRRETTLRGKLQWEPAGDWSVQLAGLFSDIDDGYDAFALDNSLTMLSDKPGQDAQRSVGGALRAQWTGPAFSFTSITSTADSHMDFSFDADWGNPDSWAPFSYDFVSRNDRQRQTLSQEFRLASAAGAGPGNGRIQWLTGLYLLRLKETLATVNQGNYYDPFFDFGLTLDSMLNSRFESTNVALFGQLALAAGDRGRWTFGLRLEDRDTDYGDSDGLSLGPGESMVGGEIAYSHELSEAVMGYVALARGYKAGGFNLGLVPAGRREFQQEVLWNLEAGIKSSWWEDRVRFDATLFHNRRRDQQVRTSFQLVPNDPASFVFFTDNAAQGETTGLEADLRWLPNETWSVYANLGVLRARFDEFVTPQVDLGGRDQAHAPRYSVALGARYQHPSGLFARLDLSSRDAFYFDVSHNEKSQAFQLAHLRLGYEQDRWTTELWIRNMLDERYAVRGFYFGNEPPDFPNALYVRRGDPRSWGLTFRLRL